MIEVITNLFDVHRRFIGRFSKYDVNIVVFLKQVTDNFASHLSPTYQSAVDDELVERFKNRYPTIPLEEVDAEVAHIKRAVRKVFDHAGHLKSSYFEVRCDGGDIVLEFQTFEDVIPSKSTLNYNVPWGSPPNTVCATHMDKFNSVCFDYLWVEDDSINSEEGHPCDIAIGNRLFVVMPGLYKYEDGELIVQDLNEVKEVNRINRPKSSYMKARTEIRCASPKPILTESTLYPVIPTVSRHGKLEGVLEVRSDGNYGSNHFEYILVELCQEQIDKGKEYDVIINDISFAFSEPGLYQFVDGEFVKAE